MSDDGGKGDRDFDPFDDEGDGERQRRLFERALPEVLRRLLESAVERGVDAIAEGPENIRRAVGDLKLPKEAAHYVYQQIDDTKKGVYRVVAKEIRDVLEHTSFADEIASVLTKLSFEINTTVRFVPNPAAHEEEHEDDQDKDKDKEEPKAEGEPRRKRTSRIPRPTVVSKVVMKARDTLERLDPRTEEDG